MTLYDLPASYRNNYNLNDIDTVVNNFNNLYRIVKISLEFFRLSENVKCLVL